jgi:hypothetical protein
MSIEKLYFFVLLKISMKKTTHFSKVRSNRIKYLKLFPLFIRDIDQVNKNKYDN